MRKTSQSSNTNKRATNVSLSDGVLAQAKALQTSVSQAAEAGVEQDIARKRAQRWLIENREVIESSNEFVERHGLPLASKRMF